MSVNKRILITIGITGPTVALLIILERVEEVSWFIRHGEEEEEDEEKSLTGSFD